MSQVNKWKEVEGAMVPKPFSFRYAVIYHSLEEQQASTCAYNRTIKGESD